MRYRYHLYFYCQWIIFKYSSVVVLYNNNNVLAEKNSGLDFSQLTINQEQLDDKLSIHNNVNKASKKEDDLHQSTSLKQNNQIQTDDSKFNLHVDNNKNGKQRVGTINFPKPSSSNASKQANIKSISGETTKSMTTVSSDNNLYYISNTKNRIQNRIHNIENRNHNNAAVGKQRQKQQDPSSKASKSKKSKEESKMGKGKSPPKGKGDSTGKGKSKSKGKGKGKDKGKGKGKGKGNGKGDCVIDDSSKGEITGKGRGSKGKGMGKGKGIGTLCPTIFSISPSPSPSIVSLFPTISPSLVPQQATPSIIPSVVVTVLPTAVGSDVTTSPITSTTPITLPASAIPSPPTDATTAPTPTLTSSTTNLPTSFIPTPPTDITTAPTPTFTSSTTNLPTSAPPTDVSPTPTPSSTATSTTSNTGSTELPTPSGSTTEQPTVGGSGTTVPTPSITTTSTDVPTISTAGPITSIFPFPSPSGGVTEQPTGGGSGTSGPTPSITTTSTDIPTISTTSQITTSVPVQGSTQAPSQGGTQVTTRTGSLAPSTSGTSATTTSNTVSPVGGNTVRATPFNIEYVYPGGGVPTDADFDEASTLTLQYLEEYFRVQFASSLDTQIENIIATSTGNNANPPTISFDYEVVFTPDSQTIITTAELDSLIQVALSPPSVNDLVAVLGKLPSTNPMSGTTSVAYSNTRRSAPLKNGMVDDEDSSFEAAGDSSPSRDPIVKKDRYSSQSENNVLDEEIDSYEEGSEANYSFSLSYRIRKKTETPTSNNIDDAVSITKKFLISYVRQQFSFNPGADVTKIKINTEQSSTELMTVTFYTSIGLSVNSSIQAQNVNSKILFKSAFEEPFVSALISVLRKLSFDNPLQATSTILFYEADDNIGRRRLQNSIQETSRLRIRSKI